MIKYLQLPFTFSAALMQQEVRQLGANWQLHFQKKHYDGNWSAIMLRSINGETENGFISPTEDPTLYNDTTLLQQCPYFSDILKQFKCPLLTVRLLNLSAGAQVHTHKDAGLNYEEGLARFHIPVITHKDVDFYLDNEKMDLHEGECWYMNLSLPHSLHNKSNTDRIHLVIDAEINGWMKELFSSPTIKNKKEETKTQSPEEKKEMIFHLRQLNTETSHRLADDLEKNL